MIVKFKYNQSSVIIDDDNGVSCEDKEAREWFEDQFDLNLDTPSSPAGIIGESMKTAGYEVEFIQGDKVY